MNNKPTRLAIFNDGQLPLPPVKGGSVPTLIDMILRENDIHHDFDIDVFSCYDKEAKKEVVGYKYSNFIYSRIFRFIRFFTNLAFKTKIRLINLKAINLPTSFKRKLKKTYYDVVLVSGYVRGAIPILTALNNNPLKIVAHHTVTDILHEPSLDGKKIYELADIITFDSEYATKFASKADKKINDKNYTHVDSIPNIEAYNNNIEQNRHEIREKYGLKEDDFVILFVGRMVEYKGIYELIEAFNLVSKQNTHLKLLLCGSITYSKKIQKNKLGRLLSSIEKNPNIIITGYVDYKDIHKIYQSVDISTMLTKIDECFGMVGIESFAAGKPLISTRTGGVVEYADDSNSIFVRKDENMVNDIAKAIEKCFKSPRMVEELGKNAKNIAQKYNQRNYYLRLKKIIERGTAKKNENIVDR